MMLCKGNSSGNDRKIPLFLLVDNGSLRSESTLSLRQTANLLQKKTGMEVLPVSLLHSDRVSPEELGGAPAETLEPALQKWLSSGLRDFVIIPFFFGPSKAITEYIPERVRRLKKQFPAMTCRIAPSLGDLHRIGSDLRLASILRERTCERILPNERPAVILVDHGSPVPAVTAVRNFLAGQLSVLLEGKISALAPAAMEMREGEFYTFNRPLLEEQLNQPGYNTGLVVVAMLFLSPGRHAGAGGDVGTICAEAEKRNPGLVTRMTDLVGNHPDLLSILQDRSLQGLESAPL